VDPVRFVISESRARFLAEIGMVAVVGGNPKLEELFYLNDHTFVIIRQIEDIEKVHRHFATCVTELTTLKSRRTEDGGSDTGTRHRAYLG
jgi:hypothetical protein